MAKEQPPCLLTLLNLSRPPVQLSLSDGEDSNEKQNTIENTRIEHRC
jgi:hypothetical protein